MILNQPFIELNFIHVEDPNMSLKIHFKTPCFQSVFTLNKISDTLGELSCC